MKTKILLIEDKENDCFRIYNATIFSNEKLKLDPIGLVGRFHEERYLTVLTIKDNDTKYLKPVVLLSNDHSEIYHLLRNNLPENLRDKEITFNTPIF